jgi:hypothetical protein
MAADQSHGSPFASTGTATADAEFRRDLDLRATAPFA